MSPGHPTKQQKKAIRARLGQKVGVNTQILRGLMASADTKSISDALEIARLSAQNAKLTRALKKAEKELNTLKLRITAKLYSAIGHMKEDDEEEEEEDEEEVQEVQEEQVDEFAIDA